VQEWSRWALLHVIPSVSVVVIDVIISFSVAVIFAPTHPRSPSPVLPLSRLQSPPPSRL
jgi:hypothetical protein